MPRTEIKAVNTKHILRRHFQPDPERCLQALELLLSSASEEKRQNETPVEVAANLTTGASETKDVLNGNCKP